MDGHREVSRSGIDDPTIAGRLGMAVTYDDIGPVCLNLTVLP